MFENFKISKITPKTTKNQKYKISQKEPQIKKSPEIKLLSELKTSKISENPQKQKFLKIKKSQTKALNQTSLENQLQ